MLWTHRSSLHSTWDGAIPVSFQSSLAHTLRLLIPNSRLLPAHSGAAGITAAFQQWSSSCQQTQPMKEPGLPCSRKLMHYIHHQWSARLWLTHISASKLHFAMCRPLWLVPLGNGFAQDAPRFDIEHYEEHPHFKEHMANFYYGGGWELAQCIIMPHHTNY